MLRALWLATFAVILFLFLMGLLSYYRQMLVAPESPNDGDPDPTLPIILAEAGIPAELYALFKLVSGVLGSFPVALIALLIFWRRGHDRSALLMSYLLLLIGSGGPVGSAALAQFGAVGMWLDRIMTVASANAVTLIFFLFPTGRFVPRWTRWVALFFFAFTLPGFVAPGSRLDFLAGGSSIGFLILVPLLACLIFAQVYRYRRVSGPVERLQTRWAMIGLLAWPLAWAISGMLIVFAPSPIRNHRRHSPAADPPGSVPLDATLLVVPRRHRHRHPALSTLRHRRHHPQDAGLHRADRAAGAGLLWQRRAVAAAFQQR